MGQRLGHKGGDVMCILASLYVEDREGGCLFSCAIEGEENTGRCADKPVASSWMWLLLEDAIMLLTGRSPQGRRTRSRPAQGSQRAGTHRGRRCERGCSPSQRLDHGYGWHIGKHFLVSMWLDHVTLACHSGRNAEGAARRLAGLVVAFRKRWIRKMTHVHVTLHFLYILSHCPPPTKPKQHRLFKKTTNNNTHETEWEGTWTGPSSPDDRKRCNSKSRLDQS